MASRSDITNVLRCQVSLLELLGDAAGWECVAMADSATIDENQVFKDCKYIKSLEEVSTTNSVTASCPKNGV